jgi:LPXTG-site transpeptidase (sortase) family protein
MKNFFSNILIALGVFLLIYSALLIYYRYSPNRLSFAYQNDNINTLDKETSENRPTPVKVRIPSVDVSLPVIESRLIGDKLETTDQGISYLTNSAYPGDTGNSIFYGHNWTSLLGSLIYVKPGDIVEIEYNDTSRREFEIVSTMEVKPNQTAVLNQTPYSTVTIYTCSGFLDSKRFVVSARPV